MDGVFMRKIFSISLCVFTLALFLQTTKWQVMFPVLCLPQSNADVSVSCIQENTQQNTHEVRFFISDVVNKLKFSLKHR